MSEYDANFDANADLDLSDLDFDTDSGLDFQAMLQAMLVEELSNIPSDWLAQNLQGIATDVSVAAAGDPLTPVVVAVIREAAKRLANA